MGDFDIGRQSLEDRLNELDWFEPADMEVRVSGVDVEITHLSVSGNARRRGVATKLVEKVRREVAAAGARRLVVSIQGGEGSARFLRSLGMSVERDGESVTGREVL